MQSIATWIMAVFNIILLIHIYRTQTLDDLERLKKINEDVTTRFKNYRVNAFRLTSHLTDFVDRRNDQVLESIQIIASQIEQSRNNQDFINNVILTQFMDDLEKSMTKERDQEIIRKYRLALQYLSSLIRQSDTIHDRLLYETKTIHKLLWQSDRYVKENIVKALFDTGK